MAIDRADHQSVSSAEVARQSLKNKIEFGIEVALIFTDLIPVAGKGVSAGFRLGKAGISALRANSRVLPHLIKRPGLGRAIYSDFTLSAAGISNVRAAPYARYSSRRRRQARLPRAQGQEHCLRPSAQCRHDP